MPANSNRSDLEKLEVENATLKVRVHDLETALGLHEDKYGVFFKLPKALSDLLGLLMSRPNVTNAIVQQRLEIASDTKVAMHRLRMALAPFRPALGLDPNQDIVCSRRGLGYWIENNVKEKIENLVTRQVTDHPHVDVSTAA